MAGLGGKRLGAGRPKGARNKATTAREKRISASGKTPLDFLVDRMRNTKAPMPERIDCAKSAAPYVHPRLQATTLEGDPSKPIQVDMPDLRELARRIALVLAKVDR